MPLARKKARSVHDYASDRVFDGTRPLSPHQVTKLRVNYLRTHGVRPSGPSKTPKPR